MSQRSAKRVQEMLGDDTTREEFIAFNWAGIEIPEWTVEHESQLPEELQNMSLFKRQGLGLVYTGPPIKT